MYVKPVLRSGLSALPIRPSMVKPLAIFQHKILRSILKLSHYSPIAPLYFMLGELPIEASLHIDILSLFWNIWVNRNTKAFAVVRYLLMMASGSSVTWSAHVRIIFQMYNLPDSFSLIAPPGLRRGGKPTPTLWLRLTMRQFGVTRQQTTQNLSISMCSVLDSLVGHTLSYRGCRPHRTQK